MRVALAQIAVTPGDVQANLAAHLAVIDRAVTAGAALIVFPELSLTGDRLGPVVDEVSLAADDPVLAPLRAASHEIDIVVGLIERGPASIAAAEGGIIAPQMGYNSALYFSQGALLHRHRKIFLVNYDVFDEGRHFLPGRQIEAFDTRQGRAAMLICNDAWHAAAPYLAAMDGAELLIVPANSLHGVLEGQLDLPETWDIMLRGYAATMGVYILFVNLIGPRERFEGPLAYWGGSKIIGPDGRVVAQAPLDEPALLLGEVNLTRAAQQRYHAPILRDAQLGILANAFTRVAGERTASLPAPEDDLPRLDMDGSTMVA